APPSRTSRRPTTRTGTCQSTPPSQHALRSSSSSPPPETPRCTPARPPTHTGRSSRSASANRAADGAAETKTPPQPHGQPTGGAEALRRSSGRRHGITLVTSPGVDVNSRPHARAHTPEHVEPCRCQQHALAVRTKTDHSHTDESLGCRVK